MKAELRVRLRVRLEIRVMMVHAHTRTDRVAVRPLGTPGERVMLIVKVMLIVSDGDGSAYLFYRCCFAGDCFVNAIATGVCMSE